MRIRFSMSESSLRTASSNPLGNSVGSASYCVRGITTDENAFGRNSSQNNFAPSALVPASRASTNRMSATMSSLTSFVRPKCSSFSSANLDGIRPLIRLAYLLLMYHYALRIFLCLSAWSNTDQPLSQGINSNLPVVSRPSSCRCASAASLNGNLRWMCNLSSPDRTHPRTSPAR
jgi:hypothetical protein